MVLGQMDRILERFREVYPKSGAPQVWRAPGRVNLIGEHTDYNLGLVLPMAIDMACWVAAALSSDDGRLRVYSEQLGDGSDSGASMNLRERARRWRLDRQVDRDRLGVVAPWSRAWRRTNILIDLRSALSGAD